jgi:hypothetical protein
MPDVGMAMNTVHAAGVRAKIGMIHVAVAHAMRGQNLIHQSFMAVHAVMVENLDVLGSNPNRLVEVLQREAFGVPEAVFRFGQVLGNEAVWRVAIVTGRHGVMAGFLPAIEVIAHDVAVDAGFGVVAEVGQTGGVMKRGSAETDQEAGHAADDEDRKIYSAKEGSAAHTYPTIRFCFSCSKPTGLLQRQSIVATTVVKHLCVRTLVVLKWISTSNYPYYGDVENETSRSKLENF